MEGSSRKVDVIVVGSGPNGFAAAIECARRGLRTTVIEGAEAVGGGVRSAELTLPGFIHDVCSAIHPMAAASPFFRSLDLGRFGLEWIEPGCPVAHPFDDGSAALLERSVRDTASALGEDSFSYHRLMKPMIRFWGEISKDILSPPHFPWHPLTFARFGMKALLPATTLARIFFRGYRACGLFAGLCAHSFLRLDQISSGAIGLVLGTVGHVSGWPLPRGGSQRLSDALRACLENMDGTVTTGKFVQNLDQLKAPLIFLDVTPRQFLKIGGNRIGSGYRKQLRSYRYGPGAFKVDWALDGPIPWRAKECSRAGTVHLGGTMSEIAASEEMVSRGEIPEWPFVLAAQQSLFDPSRAPAGRHTGWAYCHVPNGSKVDMTGRIEAQIERFAPGFRNRILARHAISPAQIEAYNPNCVGGDIVGGLPNLKQTLFRPALRIVPYSTGLKGVFLCSSSTPPGGGVHGLCGYYAAKAALR